jgi:hypothetical protein
MDEEYKIIRGKRIVDQLETEIVTEQSSYADLERNIQNFTPVTTKRQHATDPVRITQIFYLPFLGTKNLNVEALAASDGTNYTPKLIFNQVVFEDEDTPNNITFTGKDGNEYNMQPINLAQNTVRVRCDCLDFYWRFAAFNAKDKSLIGTAPKPYQRVSNRGPVNPQQVPGVCKHLIQTVKALKEAGMVR